MFNFKEPAYECRDKPRWDLFSVICPMCRYTEYGNTYCNSPSVRRKGSMSIVSQPIVYDDRESIMSVCPHMCVARDDCV